jgi:hypothetical protein
MNQIQLQDRPSPPNLIRRFILNLLGRRCKTENHLIRSLSVCSSAATGSLFQNVFIAINVPQDLYGKEALSYARLV